MVDDGSSDGMTQVGHDFARLHENVLVLTKRRGGKSSAMNFALPFARAEVVIVVDADSHLAPNAIWEIVQPLADPRVGAVSGNVLVRNEFQNLVTRLQGFEYQRSIFMGRMVSDRLNLLGIASGAFLAGSFRCTALQHVARVGCRTGRRRRQYAANWARWATEWSLTLTPNAGPTLPPPGMHWSANAAAGSGRS